MPNELSDHVPTDDDRDPSNVLLRAGYILGMANKLPEGTDDRDFLMRTYRSMRAFAALLRERDGG